MNCGSTFSLWCQKPRNAPNAGVINDAQAAGANVAPLIALLEQIVLALSAAV